MIVKCGSDCCTMKKNFNFHVHSNFKNSIPRPQKKKTKVLLLAGWLIAGAVYYYFNHPVLNIKTVFFFSYVFYGLVLIWILSLFFEPKQIVYDSKKKSFLGTVFTVVILAGVLWAGGSMLICSPVFMAKSFANRIEIQNVDFDKVKEVDFTKTPIIDRDSTIVLGDRVMGEMPELVSQFEVSTEYTQISYKDSVYRVTPLEYAGFFKFMGNYKEGIPAYILVNSVTGEAELVRLSDLGLDGMKYVPSGYFNYDLYRKLQMQYPTTIFGDPSFEIDEEGHPWYICTTYDYAAFESRKMVSGVILFDPITGESTKYDDVLDAPTWIDRIYPESLVTEQVDQNGSLQNGFINSIIGQKNVTYTSEGYNYLEQDGDIYIYSGITSANKDSSNLGFVLVNLRTHEAMKITSPGANETSAMASAEGEVKNYGYTSTFPLLVNVNGHPVYMMALKDDSGLIKMYAMVDASDYQKVATISSDEGFENLKKNFIALEGGNAPDAEDLQTKEITINTVQILTIEDTTKCFMTDSENNRYKITLSTKNEDIVAFLKAGDEVSITYIPAEDVNAIQKIERK